jgi:hypothetical protein
MHLLSNLVNRSRLALHGPGYSEKSALAGGVDPAARDEHHQAKDQYG